MRLLLDICRNMRDIIRNRPSHNSVKFSRVQSFNQLSNPNPMGKGIVFKASMIEPDPQGHGPGKSGEECSQGIWDWVVLARFPTGTRQTLLACRSGSKFVWLLVRVTRSSISWSNWISGIVNSTFCFIALFFIIFAKLEVQVIKNLAPFAASGCWKY